MAITYTTPNGTVLTTIADLATFHFGREGRAVPTNAELIVQVDRKPGTAVS